MKALGSGLVCAMLSLLSVSTSLAQDDSGNLAADIQTVKQQALELNRDLFILEEELMFPADTQVAVYLSMDVGVLFALDAVKLNIDGKEVSHYLYTARQIDALQRGGVHRLYMGNLKQGAHEVVAVFTGKGPQGLDYRRATKLTLQKGTGASYVELQIRDSEARQQPEFHIRQW